MTTPTRVLTNVQANDMRVYRKVGTSYNRLPGLSGVSLGDTQAPRTQLKGLDEYGVLIGKADIADITIDLGNIQFGHEDIRQLLLRKGQPATQVIRVETRGELIFAAGTDTIQVAKTGVVTFSDTPFGNLRNLGAGAEFRHDPTGTPTSLIARSIKSNDGFKKNATVVLSDPARTNAATGFQSDTDIVATALAAKTYSVHIPIYRWDDILVAVSGGDGFTGQVDQGLTGQMLLTPNQPTGLPVVASSQTEPYAD